MKRMNWLILKKKWFYTELALKSGTVALQKLSQDPFGRGSCAFTEAKVLTKRRIAMNFILKDVETKS
jgi:hypothetical protein